MNIPTLIKERMQFLKNLDRKSNPKSAVMLSQITEHTGKRLYQLATEQKVKHIVEIGTSAGYSTLWLALAAIKNNAKITTFEESVKKIPLATETFEQTNLTSIITLVQGNFLSTHSAHKELLQNAEFYFVDAKKTLYLDFFKIIITSRKEKPTTIVFDNVVSHKKECEPLFNYLKENRFTYQIIPEDDGILICRT